MTKEIIIQLAIDREFTYNKHTGIIKGVRGNIIKNKSKAGYICLSISNKKKYYFLGHQLAWYYTFGYLPKMIDHKDRIKTNNKISNLRETNHVINALNSDKGQGVYFEKRRNKWISLISLSSNKTKQLGTFNTKEEAHECYKEYKNKLIIKLNKHYGN